MEKASKICSVVECDRAAKCRGMCGGHYERWRKTGIAPDGALAPRRQVDACSVEGCAEAFYARGYCQYHYGRWYVSGSTATPPKRDFEVPIGKRFGRYVVIGEAERTAHGRRWLCKCDCGNERAVYPHGLKNGGTASCGCFRDEKATVHGFSNGGGRRGHPLYYTWVQMRGRCNNRNHKSYHRYGGRGIYVDARWDDFTTFVADVGARPVGDYQLDRINNDGPYAPENCRWATRTEQSANRQSCWTARDQYKVALETIVACGSGLAVEIARKTLEQSP